MQKCAKGHGAGGEGKDAPPLVGVKALPLDLRRGREAPHDQVPHRRGRRLRVREGEHAFGDAPGTLTDEELTAVLAFDLKANGVNLGGKVVDPQVAAGVVLHP